MYSETRYGSYGVGHTLIAWLIVALKLDLFSSLSHHAFDSSYGFCHCLSNVPLAFTLHLLLLLFLEPHFVRIHVPH